MSLKSRMALWTGIISQNILLLITKHYLKKVCDGDIPMWRHPIRQVVLCILVTLLYMNDAHMDLDNSRLSQRTRDAIEWQVESTINLLRDGISKADQKSKCAFCRYKIEVEEHFADNRRKKKKGAR